MSTEAFESDYLLRLAHRAPTFWRCARNRGPRRLCAGVPVGAERSSLASGSSLVRVITPTGKQQSQKASHMAKDSGTTTSPQNKYCECASND